MIGSEAAGAATASLRVSELFAALLTGVGGGRLLTAEVEKRFLEKEKGALKESRDTLATAVKHLSEQVTE